MKSEKFNKGEKFFVLKLKDFIKWIFLIVSKYSLTSLSKNLIMNPKVDEFFSKVNKEDDQTLAYIPVTKFKNNNF